MVNIADVDLDGTPDLLFRNMASGTMMIRHGKPGAVVASLKPAGADGNIRLYHPGETSVGISDEIVISTDWTAVKSFG
ncbi:hypothetical protein [Actinoplanes sp. NBRC 101535]|uniref:hypothetical protein n=1 Tax=Actinoplanes sp. NBRC 101535 TaxID=3032196 RepID=UPI0024A54EE7|nr:hypothetical protein [Actinoplanes sp. NBRC 101535]GLY03909.1 hypothetical protein Acsp01_42880 [Actinoplanes sp. NBRC 101535]